MSENPDSSQHQEANRNEVNNANVAVQVRVWRRKRDDKIAEENSCDFGEVDTCKAKKDTSLAEQCRRGSVEQEQRTKGIRDQEQERLPVKLFGDKHLIFDVPASAKTKSGRIRCSSKTTTVKDGKKIKESITYNRNWSSKKEKGKGKAERQRKKEKRKKDSSGKRSRKQKGELSHGKKQVDEKPPEKADNIMNDGEKMAGAVNLNGEAAAAEESQSAAVSTQSGLSPPSCGTFISDTSEPSSAKAKRQKRKNVSSEKRKEKKKREGKKNEKKREKKEKEKTKKGKKKERKVEKEKNGGMENTEKETKQTQDKEVQSPSPDCTPEPREQRGGKSLLMIFLSISLIIILLALLVFIGGIYLNINDMDCPEDY